jgi:hypothetical protein
MEKQSVHLWPGTLVLLLGGAIYLRYHLIVR